DSVGFVAFDERGQPATALRFHDERRLTIEPSRHSAPPRLRRDLEAIDVAPPAVPAPDHAADDRVALDRDEEAVAVRPDEPLELLERVGRTRDSAGALPEGQHRRALLDAAGSDHDRRARFLAHSRFAPHRGRPYHTSSAFERSASREETAWRPRANSPWTPSIARKKGSSSFRASRRWCACRSISTGPTGVADSTPPRSSRAIAARRWAVSISPSSATPLCSASTTSCSSRA